LDDDNDNNKVFLLLTVYYSTTSISYPAIHFVQCPASTLQSAQFITEHYSQPPVNELNLYPD